MRLVPLVFVLAVVSAAPAAGQLPPAVVIDTIDIDNGDHTLSARIESIKTTIDDELVDYRAIRLGKLTDVDSGANVSLDDSPIWRLDLRRLSELQPTAANPLEYAAWNPIPDLNPLNNIPLASGHPIAWIDVREHPEVVLKVSHDPRRRLKLEWKNLPIERWHAQQHGQVDVTVILGFVPGETGVHGSIDVRMRSGPDGKIDMALLSVSFPELLLSPLKLGAESQGDLEDDVLLSPVHHGYLVPNPIEWLDVPATDAWGPDSFVTDFSPTILGTERARKFTYPGDCSTQFMFLYDPLAESNAQEDWIDFVGNVIQGYTTRPSRRVGPTAGLYVAAHDPDLNVKRIVHDVLDQGLGKQLRLGLRTFVEFSSDRLEELKTPGVGMPGSLWQRYAQGPFVLTSEFDRADGRVLTRDPSFRWPVVLEMIDGDWIDAIERYREFFVAESHALYRDIQGDAVRLRDLPSSVLPEAHRELIGTIDLLEVTPETPPAAGAPVVVPRADDVRRYVGFLREDWKLYQDLGESVEVPLYLVTPREGMVEGAGPTPGLAVASAGSGGMDRYPRPDLPEFLFRLRVPEGRWPPKPWEGRVLVGTPRDHGRIHVNNPLIFPGFVSVFRETGHEALFETNVWLESFARSRAAANQTQRIENHLLAMRARDEEEKTFETQVDLIEMNGSGALAMPDYAEWIPTWRTGGRLPVDDVGGGNAWFEGHREMRRSMMQDGLLAAAPPALGFSTGEMNEAILQQNLPIGSRTPYPASVLEDDAPRHLTVFAEPVVMSSYLYHDYAMLRGRGVTFAQSFAMPADEVPVGSGLDPRYLDQTSPAERALGYRLSRHRLAREIVHGGLLSGVGIATAPGLQFENDAGNDGTIGSADDRVCTSDGRTAGEFDVAKDGWLAGSPPRFARDLLRARSQMRRFFIGGRRARDPVLTDPDDDPDFWADDLVVKRWAALDLSDSIGTFHGGEDASTGGMNIERLVVGTYVDDGLLDDGRRHRLMICVANPSSAQITYQLLFDTRKWSLPKTETYSLEALDLQLQAIPNFGTTPGVTWSSGNLRLPKTIGGAEPFITPYEVHFWVLRRTQ
ncbi:MAG: hypothetical protein ACF8XB_18570 [Planctomycetota bacterium JB042]